MSRNRPGDDGTGARTGRAGYDPAALERAALRWLASSGFACWTSGSPPGTEGRYGIVLHDGRRLAVGPVPRTGWTFESMARAKCDFLLLMAGQEQGAPVPAGFLTWWDARALAGPEEEIDTGRTGFHQPDDLPGLLNPPVHRSISLLVGTLRLLVSGDIPAPPPGDWSHLGLPVKER